jgi:hypothetical protein
MYSQLGVVREKTGSWSMSALKGGSRGIAMMGVQDAVIFTATTAGQYWHNEPVTLRKNLTSAASTQIDFIKDVPKTRADGTGWQEITDYAKNAINFV